MKARRVFLLLPLLFASLFPASIMPNVDANGKFSVVICTSDGLRTVTFDNDGNDISERGNDPLQDDETQGTRLCAFSAFGGTIAVLEVVPEIVAFDVASGNIAFFAPVSLPRLANSRALGARAPPVLL